MNELNYASREASQRLVDAGIVIETEVLWHINPFLNTKTLVQRTGFYGEDRIDKENHIPAPSMAEVWRELPDEDVLDHYFDKQKHFFWYDWKIGQIFSDTNPTDALIDLLIWRKGGKG